VALAGGASVTSSAVCRTDARLQWSINIRPPKKVPQVMRHDCVYHQGGPGDADDSATLV
jgi:hypothetical protein